MEELEKQSKELGKRLADAAEAENFEKSGPGKFALEYLENRASLINRKIIGAKPLSQEEYLDNHGRLAELNAFIAMLRGTQNVDPRIAEQKKDIDGQIKTIESQS